LGVLFIPVGTEHQFNVKMLHYNGGKINVYVSRDEHWQSLKISGYKIVYNGRVGCFHSIHDSKKWDIVDLTGDY